MNYLKYIAATLIILASVGGLQAQTKAERKAQRKLEKALKKEARALALEENRERITDLIHNQTFVLEATAIIDRRQNRFEVSPTINFVKIDGEEGVVQFGFNHLVGYNGLGGLTLRGRLSSYEVNSENPKGPITLTAVLSSTGLIGAATLNMTIADNGLARATIIGSFGSRLTFVGGIYDLEETRAYQGNPVL